MSTFNGKARYDDGEHQIDQLEQNFYILRVTEDSKLNVVVAFLVADAFEWWKGVAPTTGWRATYLE